MNKKIEIGDNLMYAIVVIAFVILMIFAFKMEDKSDKQVEPDKIEIQNGK